MSFLYSRFLLWNNVAMTESHIAFERDAPHAVGHSFSSYFIVALFEHTLLISLSISPIPSLSFLSLSLTFSLSLPFPLYHSLSHFPSLSLSLSLSPIPSLSFSLCLCFFQVKAAVDEFYLNGLEMECVEVTREMVHPNGMGDVLKVRSPRHHMLYCVMLCRLRCCVVSVKFDS